MLYNGLKAGCASYEEFILRQLALGLDPYVQLPPRPPVIVNDHYNLHGLPVTYDPRVTVAEWIERPADEACPLLVKEYRTPAGTLRTEVRQTPDWRWGDHLPFLDDYIVPRARRFPVRDERDLAALRYLLAPLTREQIAAFRDESAPALALAGRHDLLIAAGWGVGADLIGWVCGLEEMTYMAFDRPDFLDALLGSIAIWNRARMAALLENTPGGVDLCIKRAWYENCDFFTPAAWRRHIFPILKAEVDLAHATGARFGYLITARCMPLLDMIAEAGVDVVIGVDPRAWDLAAARSQLGGKVCLWGGVNGHLTVEQGAPEAVRAEVRVALELLAPGGGFILSPVDNVREDTPRSRANVAALIAEWQIRR